MATTKKVVSATSVYSRQMQRLSNRIFGEVYKTTPKQSLQIVKQFQELPVEQNDFYNQHYYPAPHPMMHFLTKLLRLHGIYRDEHEDFNEHFDRERARRGKVPPIPGHGKRSKLRQQGLK